MLKPTVFNNPTFIYYRYRPLEFSIKPHKTVGKKAAKLMKAFLKYEVKEAISTYDYLYNYYMGND